MKPNFCSLFLGVTLAFLYSCTPKHSADFTLASQFPLTTMRDTLHLELSDDAVSAQLGDTLAQALFFQTLDTLLQPIDYLADSSSCTAIALQRFELNQQYDACLVQINQFWFKHQSILLFDKAQQKFTQRTTVAEWYGGDGGQILTGSWLFDYDQDGDKDLVRRVIEHSSMPNEEGGIEEKMAESAELLLWQKNAWVKVPVKDSIDLVKRYPIHSAWE